MRADGTSSQKTSPTYKSSGAAAAPSSRAATEAEQNLDDWLDSLTLTSPSQRPGASASASTALGAANSTATAGGFGGSSHNASSSALWSSPSPTGKGGATALAPSFSPEAARSSQSRYQQFGLATTLAAAEPSNGAASATNAATAASGGTPKAAARKTSGADLDNSWDEDDFAATRSRATAPGGGGGGGGFSLASLSNTSFPAPKAASAGASAKTRCSQVVLGAARCSRGLRASAFSPCVCDALLCSQCNFKVLSFADRRWQAAADYLFLRNNMPNRDKLATRLDAAPGAVAYCCQCRSATVSPDEDSRVLVIGAAQDPQWICTGHAS